MELITCLICKKQFGRLVIHLKTHGLNTKQYREMFPGSITTPVSLCNKAMQTRKKTFITKYGVDNPMNLPEIKTKVQEAADRGWRKKYHGKRGFQVKEVYDKGKNTCVEKYGYAQVMYNEDIKQKNCKSRINTIYSKYGVSNVMKLPTTVEHWQTTLQEKYGVISPIQIEGSLEKRETTWKEKYGVNHPLQLQETINRRRERCYQNHGVNHPMQLKEVTKRNRDTYIRNCIKNGLQPFTQVGITTIEQAIIDLHIQNLEYVGQRSFWIHTSKGYRNPDFVCKQSKKIIECFGDYWHTLEQEKELITLYKEQGYECLIFWEKEIRTNLQEIHQNILSFLKL